MISLVTTNSSSLELLGKICNIAMVQTTCTICLHKTMLDIYMHTCKHIYIWRVQPCENCTVEITTKPIEEDRLSKTRKKTNWAGSQFWAGSFPCEPVIGPKFKTQMDLWKITETPRSTKTSFSCRERKETVENI